MEVAQLWSLMLIQTAAYCVIRGVGCESAKSGFVLENNKTECLNEIFHDDIFFMRSEDIFQTLLLKRRSHHGRSYSAIQSCNLKYESELRGLASQESLLVLFLLAVAYKDANIDEGV